MEKHTERQKLRLGWADESMVREMGDLCNRDDDDEVLGNRFFKAYLRKQPWKRWERYHLGTCA